MQLKNLLRTAQNMQASDLHLVCDLPPVIRVHGVIRTLSSDVLHPPDISKLIYEVLNDDQKKALERDWQLCFSLSIPDIGYFRINLYYHLQRLEASIRVGTLSIKTFEELGLPSMITSLASRPNGLFLITGPTGAGKTTTFNSIIDRINRERRAKIVTVEDPIEFIHQNHKSIVIQQEVHSDVKSFSSAIIHILRQDPDVIGIGEMREIETIRTALTAAETGHLVIATLHTNDASRTINRIIDVFPWEAKPQIRNQLSSSLVGIISQRLLPRVKDDGRVLACELLIANEAVRNVIREDKVHTLPNVMLTGQHQGMQLMDRSILNYYQQGTISYDTAVSNVGDLKSFKNAVHGKK